jgi:lipopolysaccharide transport system ATP-binding protein
MSLAIKVTQLGKKYTIGKRQGVYKTFRETIEDAFLYPLRIVSRSFKNIPTEEMKEKEIWALKDVSFEVQSGETLGIIGRNGVGKTTLLKILSKITPPTVGRAEIYGRVGSLLEVGTGFHSELTGHENIYLNGAILGMRRSEIKSKFDEIVSFAEIDKFVDTPVKHYSSGMYMRLAFAVAAYLEPEILLVDEVLAVGDIAFQKKCLKKMRDVGQEGRTVLFVSHNMPAIKTLCSRAIVLHQGSIQYEGETGKALQYYISENSTLSSRKVWIGEDRPGNQTFRLNSVKLKNDSKEEVSVINISKGALIEIDFELLQDGGRAQFSLVLFDAEGNCVFGSLSNTEPNFYSKPMKVGNYRILCRIYGNLLNSGHFYISIRGGCAYWSDAFTVDRVIAFDAIDDGILKGDYPGGYSGVVRPKLIWETVSLTTQGNESL